jgi:feruloyl esterase
MSPKNERIIRSRRKFTTNSNRRETQLSRKCNANCGKRRQKCGWIWVESELEHGSTFHLALRFGTFAESEKGKLSADVETVHQLACQDPGSLDVLVVEDNPVNLRLMTRLLEKRGHRTLTAGNGRVAVDVLEKAGWQGIDVVLMDLQMPELNGFEATVIIRERESTFGSHLPIIAVVAHALEGYSERCLSVRMNRFVAKPLKASEPAKFPSLVTLAPAWDYSLTLNHVLPGVSHMKTRVEDSGRPRVIARLVGLGVLLCSSIAAAPVSAMDCKVDALNALGVPNMTIKSATDIAAAAPNPQFCDVKGSVATSGVGAGPNTAGFEAMLPANWNGKFIFNGVGGLAGNLNSSANPVDQALFLSRGYATAITDTGHLSTEPTWEFTSPGEPNTPKVVDYFYRAVHEVTLATKLLVKNYYHTTTIAHSYFDGCSNGGKMGLLEAMRFPNDYDGIIAGSPWLDPVGTSLWSLKNVKALLDAYIPLPVFATVGAAITKQCDAADGVADGLIQNPTKCAFNPDALVPETLTQKQADALKLIMKPVTDEKGNLVYPGSSVSNLGQANTSPRGPVNQLETPAANPGSARPWGDATPPGNWNLATGILLSLGYYDTDVDLNHAIENNGVVQPAPLKLVYDRLAADIPDDPTRYGAFFAQGGKLLIYHGYDDLIISPYSSIWFYEDLAEKNGGYEKLDGHARLFMVPGMQHCVGGSGPNTFDTLSALETWVEKGVAPDAILATHSTNSVIDRTMPLCKFPEEAHYKGSGDVTDSSNWSCPLKDQSLLAVGPNGAQAGVGAPGRGAARILSRSTSKAGN